MSLLPTCRAKRRTSHLLPLLAALILGSLNIARADEAKPFLTPLVHRRHGLATRCCQPDLGWTTPGNPVNMALNGKAARVTAWPDGKWAAHVGPFKAGGPYTLTVKGPSSATFKNRPLA